MSGPFIYDQTPPIKPTVTPTIPKRQTGTPELRLIFANISDPESGIARIEYCIGTATGTEDVLRWESVGTATSAAVDLSKTILVRGNRYYIGARTFNNAGMQSLEFWTSVQGQ